MYNTTSSSIQRIEFTPPEAVAIGFTIASCGARIGAQMLDLMITLVANTLIITLLLISEFFPMNVVAFIAIILLFFIRVPYYTFSELIWNGRTLGKRIVGIRVINKDGRRLTPHQIVARNLMKEMEFFSPLIALVFLGDVSFFWQCVVVLWVIILLSVVFFNRGRQRLGDMVAGTIVVQNPSVKLLPDLAIEREVGVHVNRFDFLDHHLDIYGRFELQILENILRTPQGKHNMSELHKITQAIIKKINYTDPVGVGEELLFLREFYRSQRQYLEKLRLFGNRRENKYHVSTSS